MANTPLPKAALESALQRALTDYNDRFAPYIDLLSTSDDAMRALFSRVDYFAQPLGVAEVEERMNLSIQRLRGYLTEVGTAEELAKALQVYVEDEMAILAFMSNDPLSAGLMGDVLSDFIEGTIAGLALDDAQKALLRASGTHYMQGLEAYQYMRAAVEGLTDGKTHSLLELVEESYDGDKDTQGVAAGMANIGLSRYALLAYGQIAENLGVPLQNAGADIRDFLIAGLIWDVLREKNDLPPSHLEASVYGKQLGKRTAKIRAEKEAAYAQSPDWRRTSDIIAGLREDLRHLRGEPKDLHTLLADACAAGMHGVPNAWSIPYDAPPPCRSQPFSEMYGVGMAARAQSQIDDLLKLVNGQVKAAKTLDEAVEQVSDAAMELADGLHFYGIEPRVAGAFAGYVKAFRMTLSSGLDHTHPRAVQALQQLAQVERMVKLLPENTRIGQDWLYFSTDKGWNSYWLESLVTHSGISGKPVEMFDETDKQDVYAGAHAGFVDCCKQRGLNGEALQSPWAPLLLEKAYEVALLQQETPAKGARKSEAGFADTIAKQRALLHKRNAQERKEDKAVYNKAVAVLRETVNALPRDTDARGRSMKPALDSVEKVLQVYDTLEQTRLLLAAPCAGRAC